ncbi:MAG: hypothetical protein KH016_01855 [Haemophilus parainfluenzae]|nr:hypothetical protein [Haemophilus parainfluenzae]
MNLEQIARASISDFQMLMDVLSPSLAVGPIRDQDFRILSSGWGDINWDCIINKYDPDDSFDFCVKLKDVDCCSNKLLGAFLSLFIHSSETLEIHGIQNFDDTSVLKGRMFLYSLFACHIFMRKVNGKFIKLIDVAEDADALRGYYKQFGFVEDGHQDLIISLDALENHLQAYLETKE